MTINDWTEIVYANINYTFLHKQTGSQGFLKNSLQTPIDHFALIGLR